jgi:AcrR family transcriptional regulator
MIQPGDPVEVAADQSGRGQAVAVELIALAVTPAKARSAARSSSPLRSARGICTGQYIPRGILLVMPRSRAPRLPAAERAPLILDATIELLRTRPGEGISMDAIAAHAGVAKPSVYNCFPTKAELFAAVAEREERHIRDLVRGSLANLDPNGSAEELLAAGLGAILESVAARPAGWRLVYPLIEPKEPMLARRMLAVRKDNLTMTEQLCRHYLERHGAADAEDEARFLAHMVAGVLDQLIELVLAGDEPDPREAARRAARLLAGGIEALLEPSWRP